MKGLILAGSMLLALTANAQKAAALDVDIAGTQITLAAPAGYCLLDKQHPLDSRVISFAVRAVQSRNDVLGMFAECGRLDDWRNGKAPDIGYLANYQVTRNANAQRYTAKEAITSVCDVVRKQGAEILKGVEGEIAKNIGAIEELAGNLKINSQQLYGVLLEDDTGCYAGIVQKIQVQTAVETLFIVVTTTVIKNKLVYFYHSGSFTDTSMITKLLDISRATIKSTLAQN